MNEYTYELIRVGFFNWRWRIKMIDQQGESWYLDSSDKRVYFKHAAQDAARSRINWLQHIEQFEQERTDDSIPDLRRG